MQETLAVGRALAVATPSADASTACLTAVPPVLQEPKCWDPLQSQDSEAYVAHGRSPFPHPDGYPVGRTSEQLPAHLGWGSEGLTRSLRASAARQAKRAAHKAARSLDWLAALAPVAPPSGTSSSPTPVPPPQPKENNSELSQLKVYPSVALGILRGNLAAAGRIWLLLRHLDTTNRGWIDAESAARQLTGKGEPLRVCGRRQWRNLIKQGEGIFWQQANGRLWLRSVAKVAAALGVERLSGRPVAVPVAVLTQGIGSVRAHLYATFHSSRASQAAGNGRPISRRTLQSLSNVGRRSQQAYEQRANIRVQRNDALGPVADSSNRQELAWQRGTAHYQLTDYHGRHGPSRMVYLAWQLPNSYSGPHEPLPRGRQKRINRELVDLFTNGMTGNDALPIERPLAEQQPAIQQTAKQQSTAARFQQRYASDGKAAGLAARQGKAASTLYWPAINGRRRKMWYAWDAA